MKRVHILVALMAVFASQSCEMTVESSAEDTTTLLETAESATHEEEHSVNKDSLVQHIDARRAQIEAGIGEGQVLSTENLRAKVKQKWSKMHFYTLNDEVVRIKTYPHESISQRTEEFYLENGSLILAVIEDNGLGERGKGNEDIDKRYYFHKDEVIHEERRGEEEEYGIRQSDGEELLTEVKEYLEIYHRQN